MTNKKTHIRVSNRPEQSCVWSQAGVIQNERCESDFICEYCDTDMALRKRAAQHTKSEKNQNESQSGPIKHWKDKLREKPANQRPCVHSMKDQIDYRICTNDYHCVNCEFNQYFQDQFAVHAVMNPVELIDLKGFKVPHGYYFHSGHTWLKLESNRETRVGLDDFAHRLLGRADRIVTPLLGKKVKRDEPCLRFLKGQNEIVLKSPVTGVITALNTDIRENGTGFVETPYTDGWLIRVYATELRDDLKTLLIGAEDKLKLDGDLGKLYDLIESMGTPLAADGGDLVEDLISVLPEIGWDRLSETFF